MTRDHHPSSGLLAAYAAGELPLAGALPISAHLEGCSACRDHVRASVELGGQELFNLAPAPMRPGSLVAALRRLDERPPAPKKVEPTVLGDIMLPAAAAGVGFGPRRWVAPGFWVAHSKARPHEGWRAFLLRAPAGATIPQHGHTADELICVLKGSFVDERRYSQGDFVRSGAGQSHTHQVTEEGPCACLIAIRGPIRWSGLGARLAGLALGVKSVSRRPAPISS